MLVLADEDLLLPCPAAFPPKKVADCLKSVAETEDDDDYDEDEEIEEPRSSVANPQQPVVPRRKDLCKLLGLNENTVGDVLIVDDHQVKVAQKVPLRDMISFLLISLPNFRSDSRHFYHKLL